MKQVVAGSGGTIAVIDIPAPSADEQAVLVAVERSLISSGTERAALAQSGNAVNLVRRAVIDPELRTKGLRRVQSRGIGATLDEVRRRAAGAHPLGYSAAGTVIGVGTAVRGIALGQRVAASGSDYASHAEVISVPQSLVTPIPDGVDIQDAAFTTIAAIALHALRLGSTGLGEKVAVIGLGLVGQLALQLASAAGCRTFGADPSVWRRSLTSQLVRDARVTGSLGDLSAMVDVTTHTGGVDAVLVTAASREPGLANRCLRLLRDRGRLIVVGDVPVHLDRDLMYRREVSVQVSRSYGPGRYDASYEERGVDYPIGHVRWTEGRNLAAVLDLIDRHRLSVGPLVTAVVPIDEAARAYELTADRDTQLGVILTYPRAGALIAQARQQGKSASTFGGESPARSTRAPTTLPPTTIRPEARKGHLTLALIGPGAFTASVLAPALRSIPEVRVQTVVARRPADAWAGAGLLGAPESGADVDAMLEDERVDAVVIATRHDSHAELARRALVAGKHVFTEKPLGLTVEECEGVVEAAARAGRLCMVDFNRRFSPHAALLRRAIADLGSGISLIYRVNAGPLPPDHWLLDPLTGGGRVVGEAVHFFDLLCWLFDHEPIDTLADSRAVVDPANEAVCTLLFPRGRSATLVYSAQGNVGSGKERIELIGGGHVWTVDDFRRTCRDGRTVRRGREAKGHAEALHHFVQAGLGRSTLTVTAVDGLRATRLALDVRRHTAIVAPSTG